MCYSEMRKKQEKWITKKHKETLGDGNVHYLEYYDGFLSVKSYHILHFMCSLMNVNYPQERYLKKSSLW